MRTLLLVSWIAWSVGCSSTDPTVVPHPVRGSVFVNDQPAVGAIIVFHPTGGDGKVKSPTGIVDSAGAFQLSTITTHDGAPAGDYDITIVWPAGMSEGEPGPDRLKGRFRDPKRPVARVTIKAGRNDLEPFKLK